MGGIIGRCCCCCCRCCCCCYCCCRLWVDVLVGLCSFGLFYDRDRDCDGCDDYGDDYSDDDDDGDGNWSSS